MDSDIMNVDDMRFVEISNTGSRREILKVGLTMTPYELAELAQVLRENSEVSGDYDDQCLLHKYADYFGGVHKKCNDARSDLLGANVEIVLRDGMGRRVSFGKRLAQLSIVRVPRESDLSLVLREKTKRIGKSPDFAALEEQRKQWSESNRGSDDAWKKQIEQNVRSQTAIRDRMTEEHKQAQIPKRLRQLYTQEPWSLTNSGRNYGLEEEMKDKSKDEQINILMSFFYGDNWKDYMGIEKSCNDFMKVAKELLKEKKAAGEEIAPFAQIIANAKVFMEKKFFSEAQTLVFSIVNENGDYPLKCGSCGKEEKRKEDDNRISWLCPKCYDELRLKRKKAYEKHQAKWKHMEQDLKEKHEKTLMVLKAIAKSRPHFIKARELGIDINEIDEPMALLEKAKERMVHSDWTTAIDYAVQAEEKIEEVLAKAEEKEAKPFNFIVEIVKGTFPQTDEEWREALENLDPREVHKIADKLKIDDLLEFDDKIEAIIAIMREDRESESNKDTPQWKVTLATSELEKCLELSITAQELGCDIKESMVLLDTAENALNNNHVDSVAALIGGAKRQLNVLIKQAQKDDPEETDQGVPDGTYQCKKCGFVDSIERKDDPCPKCMELAKDKEDWLKLPTEEKIKSLPKDDEHLRDMFMEDSMDNLRHVAKFLKFDSEGMHRSVIVDKIMDIQSKKEEEAKDEERKRFKEEFLNLPLEEKIKRLPKDKEEVKYFLECCELDELKLLAKYFDFDVNGMNKDDIVYKIIEISRQRIEEVKEASDPKKKPDVEVKGRAPVFGSEEPEKEEASEVKKAGSKGNPDSNSKEKLKTTIF